MSYTKVFQDKIYDNHNQKLLEHQGKIFNLST
nr:MAG TPA: hypothetical protein [Caudoviricetes sp.]